MIIAVGYVRRSKKSEAKTISLQEQREQIERYCVAHDFELTSVVSHDGVSGTKRERFQDIEVALALSHARLLVIYNLDRLARDGDGLMGYLKLLHKRGIVVHETSSGLINLNKALERFTVSVRGAVDEMYAGLIGEKTKDALRYKREHSQRYTNLPPFGMAYRDGLIVLEPEEPRALGLIQGYRVKGLGARRAQKALKEAGYSGRMGVTTLHRLLKTPKITPDLPQKSNVAERSASSEGLRSN